MTHYSGIRGKRVLITGATSGLGFAMAKALLSEEARVFVTERNLDKVNKAVSELRALPGTCHGAVIDVRDEASIRSGLAEMLRQWDGVDVLINNAAIGMRTVNPSFITEPSRFGRCPPKDFEHWSTPTSQATSWSPKRSHPIS